MNNFFNPSVIFDRGIFYVKNPLTLFTFIRLNVIITSQPLCIKEIYTMKTIYDVDKNFKANTNFNKEDNFVPVNGQE